MSRNVGMSSWQLGATAAREGKTLKDCTFKTPAERAYYLEYPPQEGWLNGFLFARRRMLEEARLAELCSKEMP